MAQKIILIVPLTFVLHIGHFSRKCSAQFSQQIAWLQGENKTWTSLDTQSLHNMRSDRRCSFSIWISLSDFIISTLSSSLINLSCCCRMSLFLKDMNFLWLLWRIPSFFFTTFLDCTTTKKISRCHLKFRGILSRHKFSFIYHMFFFSYRQDIFQSKYDCPVINMKKKRKSNNKANHKGFHFLNHQTF